MSGHHSWRKVRRGNHTVATRLEQLVPGLSVDYIGGICPIQMYASYTHDEVVDQVYFRFRNDCAQLYVGPGHKHKSDYPGEPEIPDLANPRLYASRDDVTGDEYVGFLDDDPLYQLVGELFLELHPLTNDEKTQHTLLSEYLNAYADALKQRKLSDDD